MHLRFTFFTLAAMSRFRRVIRVQAGFREHAFKNVNGSAAWPGLAKIIGVLRPVTFGNARTYQEGGSSIQDTVYAMTL